MHCLLIERSTLLEERWACGYQRGSAELVVQAFCMVVSPSLLCCSPVTEGCRPLSWGLQRRPRQVGAGGGTSNAAACASNA